MRFSIYSAPILQDADYIQNPQQIKGEHLHTTLHSIGPMNNPCLKTVSHFKQSYLRCLLSCHAKSSAHPGEGGKAAEESQDSFKKMFSKTAYGTLHEVI